MLKSLLNIFKASEKPQKKSPYDDFWYSAIPALSAAGVPVTPENALKVSAIWACNKVICETIALLPFLTYQKQPDGGKQRAENHYLYLLLKESPNKIQTSFEWRMTLLTHKNLYGRAYSPIKRDYFGNIIEFGLPIHPTQVQNQLMTDDTLRYKVTRNGESRIYLQDEMLYLPGITLNGYDGISPIEAGSDTIGLARATELFGAKFFQKGARPNAVLEHPNTLSETAQKRLVKSVKRMAEEGVLVTEEGIKYSSMSNTPEESQFLQTRQHQIEEVCRWYRMPPHKIAHLLRSTFTNIEHQSLEFATDTILPQVKSFEGRIKKTVLTGDDYFCEMLMEGLLRGDIKTRQDAYTKEFYRGTLSRNEIRILENRNPIPGGDNYYMQTNMTRISEDGTIESSGIEQVKEPTDEE